MQNPGSVWWTELNTHHPEKAGKFYARLFNFTVQTTALADMSRPPKAGEAAYSTFLHDGKPALGCMHMDGKMFEAMPDHWFTYFYADDVDAHVKTVLAEGGKVIRPAWDIPGVGRIAIVADSNGAVFGLGTPRTQPPAAVQDMPAPAKKAAAAKPKKPKP